MFDAWEGGGYRTEKIPRKVAWYGALGKKKKSREEILPKQKTPTKMKPWCTAYTIHHAICRKGNSKQGGLVW